MWQHGKLNRAFRLIFNRARGIWMVAAETAKGRKRPVTSPMRAHAPALR